MRDLQPLVRRTGFHFDHYRVDAPSSSSATVKPLSGMEKISVIIEPSAKCPRCKAIVCEILDWRRCGTEHEVLTIDFLERAR